MPRRETVNDLSAETSLGFGDVEAVPNPRPERNQAIDWLRGAVMILMALDHSRMFVGPAVDLHTAAPGLYFTRWVTHFCAPVFVLQVIWAIGVSMVVLAALVWLPRSAIAAFAVALIAGHNLFDAIRAADLGALRWVWLLLHEEGGLEPFPGARWIIIYPLVPWVAVMAAGYVIGPWALLPRDVR